MSLSHPVSCMYYRALSQKRSILRILLSKATPQCVCTWYRGSSPCIYTYSRLVSYHIDVYTYICIHSYVYTYMYTHICIHIYVYTYMYTHTCTHIYVYTYMYTHICTHIYVQCIYTYRHSVHVLCT